mmetsp:Transcript_49860/g.143514  ORF Transcript_49860/g.143514 Transcript_49860/m.143514 type:complete len:215 (-) Transcript_49860:1133-1777(-)
MAPSNASTLESNADLCPFHSSNKVALCASRIAVSRSNWSVSVCNNSSRATLACSAWSFKELFIFVLKFFSICSYSSTCDALAAYSFSVMVVSSLTRLSSFTCWALRSMSSRSNVFIDSFSFVASMPSNSCSRALMAGISSLCGDKSFCKLATFSFNELCAWCLSVRSLSKIAMWLFTWSSWCASRSLLSCCTASRTSRSMSSMDSSCVLLSAAS